MTEVVKFGGDYREDFYWKRVGRNLGWLGDTDGEARRRQELLRDCRIGVAGCGGIGGSVAERLARLGVRHLKIADMDTFEVSNINRQIGATAGTVGENKALTVGRFIHDMAPDVDVEAYPEGITKETVAEFIDGCDYIVDEIEPYAFRARYVLHQEFRRATRPRFIMTGHVYGHQTFLWKWTRDSMPIEDILGVSADEQVTPATARRLMTGLIPERSVYPAMRMQDHWLIEEMTCPIISGTPAMSVGLIVDRLTMAITGTETVADSREFPEAPGYAVMDSRTWRAKFVHRTRDGLAA